MANATRYVAWLLRVNRRLGPDKALRSGRAFALAFRGGHGRPLSPSHVTRWESGELVAGRDTIRRYEQLLGLPSELLMTVADAVMRLAVDGGPLRDGRRPRPNRDRSRLHNLLDAITTNALMTGSDWGELTELISSRPDLELYPVRLWRDIADRLLDELVSAVGSAWLQRQEAMSRLIEHRTAGPYAVAACIDLAKDRSSPAVIEPLSLLDVTDDPLANRHVLQQIQYPDNERAMHGALLAALRKVTQGHFRPDEQTKLVASISALMNDPATADPLLPLVVEVGRRLAERLPDRDRLARRLPTIPVAQRIWTAHRIAEPMAAQVAAARIAAQAQSLLATHVPGTDEVLAAVVEEAIFVPNPDQRLAASMLIAATPYRLPVAEALLREIKSDLARRGDTYPPAAALRALTQLGVDIHRPLIHDILTKPGFTTLVQHAAAWATPFCRGQHPEPAWRQIFATQLAAWQRSRLGLAESIVDGITFGIGTDGHRNLLAEIRDDPRAPLAARKTASWLLARDVPRG